MEWMYNKKLWWIVSGWVISLLAVFIVAYNTGDTQGSAAEKAKIDGKIVKYEELTSKIEAKEDELQKMKSAIGEKTDELNSVRSNLAANQNKFDQLMKVKKNKDEIMEKIESSKGVLDNLQDQIKTSEDKLATITAGVQEAQGEPKKLGAGIFYVGQDLPVGRYKVVPIGEGSNFSVWKPNGGLVASTILGDGGVPSFVFTALPNQKIENNAPAKFIPVE